MFLFVRVPHVCRGSQRPKKVLDPLQLELQAIMGHPVWVLATELEFSARAASTLIDEPSLESP